MPDVRLTFLLFAVSFPLSIIIAFSPLIYMLYREKVIKDRTYSQLFYGFIYLVCFVATFRLIPYVGFYVTDFVEANFEMSSPPLSNVTI